MQIKDIEVILLRCSISDVYPHPIASFVSEGSMLVKVYTDDGVVGIGEPSPYGGALLDVKTIIETNIRPRFIGKNPFDVEILTTQNEFPEGFGYGNVPYNCAVAGISQALWDIIGKAMEMPVYRLLNRNGNYKDRVRAYASGGMTYETADYEILIDEVLQYKEMGYSAWKLRPYTPLNAPSHMERNKKPPPVDIHKFISILERIRLAVGDGMDLMVDAGCRLQNIDEAVSVSQAMQELSFSFIEEPLPRVIEDYVELSKEIQIPIAGGECLVSRRQFRPWVDAGAYDILQPDGNLAGISEVMMIASMADAKGLPCIIHNWANDVSIAANVHLAAAIPNCPMVEYNVTYNPLRTELVMVPFIPEDGFFILPERPGLGIELDEKALRRFSY